MNRKFALAGCALLLYFISPAARAVTINSLDTPTDIQLPNDGLLYSFTFEIEITPNANEAAGGFLPVVFRDSVIGVTQFDWVSLNVPPNEVGNQLDYEPTLSIGCTNSPTPNIFGPLGTFNNDADTAEYFFPSLNNLTMGAVKIECNIVDPNAPGPPFVPTASGRKKITPSGSPYPGNGLLPINNYLAIGSGVTPTDVLPEPSTAWLVLSGFGTCATMISRRRKSPN